MTVLTWDTSGDFDGAQSQNGVVHRATGDFSDTTIQLGAETKNALASYNVEDAIVENLSDQAHVNVIGPAAIEANGLVFIVFAGENHDPFATAYDVSAGTFTQPVTKVGTNQLSGDTHGAPSIVRDSSGYLHVFYGSHNNEQQHKKSTNTDDITSWDAESNFGSSATYPRPAMVGSDIYVSVRTSFTNGTLALYDSSDNGATWNGPTTIIDYSGYTNDAAIYGGIIGVSSNGTDIHIAWAFADGGSGPNRFHCHHIIYETDTGSLRDMAGNSFTAPLDKSTAEGSGVIQAFDSGSQNTNSPSGLLDSNDNPHMLFNYDDAGTWKSRHIYWTGSAWSSVSDVTTTNEQFNVGNIVHYSDTNIVAYICTSDTAGTKGGDIEKWTFDGSSWSGGTDILSSSLHDTGGFFAPKAVQNPTGSLKVISGPIEDVTSCAKIFAAQEDGTLITYDGTVKDEVLWAALNEDSGSIAEDSSSYSNDGTVNGSISLGQTGMNGRTCYEFTQSDTQYVEFSGFCELNNLEELTICAWINSAGYTWNSGARVLDRFTGADNTGYFLATEDDSGNPFARCLVGDGSSNIEVVGSTDIQDDAWHFLSARILSGSLDLIVDMTQEDTATFSGTVAADSNPIQLGKNNQGGSTYQGKMQDVRVFRRGLTDSELQSIYDAATGGSYTSSKKAA